MNTSSTSSQDKEKREEEKSISYVELFQQLAGAPSTKVSPSSLEKVQSCLDSEKTRLLALRTQLMNQVDRLQIEEISIRKALEDNKE